MLRGYSRIVETPLTQWLACRSYICPSGLIWSLTFRGYAKVVSSTLTRSNLFCVCNLCPHKFCKLLCPWDCAGWGKIQIILGRYGVLRHQHCTPNFTPTQHLLLCASCLSPSRCQRCCSPKRKRRGRIAGRPEKHSDADDRGLSARM